MRKDPMALGRLGTPSPPNPPFRLVAYLPLPISAELLADRNLGQAKILSDGPDDGQATGFGREGIDLIGALPDEASQAGSGTSAANGAMHDRWEGIQRQQMFFIDASAAHGF